MGGASIFGEARKPVAPRLRVALALLIGAVVSLIAAPAAQATFHLISIREVYPGSAALPQASYVELQMYEGGQNFVGGHGVTLYNSTGGVIGTFAFASSLPGPSVSQQAILVGDSGVESAFGVKPDLVNSAFNVPASGGAACWAGSIDCVAWGNFTGSTPTAVGAPVDGAGIPDGSAIRRKISGGSCTNLLDAADDTNDSATDFGNATPAPVSYATVPGAATCTPPPSPPTAVIDTKPPGATSSTSASFTFHSNPAGAEFECRLDVQPFAACNSGSASYPGPLSEASHTFEVRALNANGTGAPASYTWTVDLTPPAASITSHPADPSPGASASFRYSSNEAGSKFECRLNPVEGGFSPCNTQPKVYTMLADGEYEFEVRAIDLAGNVQPSPTAFHWTVDNSLADTTPPETTIVSKPPDPSDSSIASFTYESNEPGSRFECKLDGASFASCPTSGIVYTDLGNGQHTFQVQAIDASNNTDPTPAGYTFNVVLAIPPAAGPTAILSLPQLLAPETVLDSKPKAKTRDRTPTFRFRAASAGALFQCRVDAAPFKPCRSPFTTKSLARGRHTVQIRALQGGIPDPTPASCTFRVVKRR
jgi:hypothetical protein